jgi:hypothetical protein
MFVVYQMTLSSVEPQAVKLKERVSFLSEELSALSSRYKRNQARMAVVEREAEVFRRANALLRSEESEHQAERIRNLSELDFYRRLAGASAKQAGLTVYAAELISTDSDRVFQFILTLTQNIRRASVIDGRANISVEGTLDNKPVTLIWSQVSDGATPLPFFQFKYFQQLEGYVAMPEMFHPLRLRVALEVEGQREPIIRAFNWAEIVTESWKSQGSTAE